MSIKIVEGPCDPIDAVTAMGQQAPGCRPLHPDVQRAIEKLQYAVAVHHNATLEAVNLTGFWLGRPRETLVTYIGDVHVFFSNNPEV